MSPRKLAIVTGASSGIGLEIAKLAAQDGYDLLVAADTPFVEAGAGAQGSRRRGAADRGAISRRSRASTSCSRPSANARSTSWSPTPATALAMPSSTRAAEEWRHVIDTNITGTLLLVQPIVQRMVERGEGKVLITGSIAGHMAGIVPGGLQRQQGLHRQLRRGAGNEIKDTGVTVTCLKPGATDTEFFHRAELDDTKVGQAKKDDPADVAKTGWDAMKERRAVRHLRAEEQDAGRGRGHDDRRDDREVHRAQTEPGSGVD